MNKLKAKEKEFNRVRLEYMELERKTREEKDFPKAKKLEGRLFKTRNSYGGSEKDDKWWLYIRVVEVRKDGSLLADEMQMDCMGRLEVHLSRKHMWNRIQGFLECSREEWDEAAIKARNATAIL